MSLNSQVGDQSENDNVSSSSDSVVEDQVSKLIEMGLLATVSVSDVFGDDVTQAMCVFRGKRLPGHLRAHPT
jgi:hypothetical protein